MLKKLLATLLALFTACAVFAATDVNTASQAELDAVKGIGPALSARIVDARKTGPFKDWGDLVSRVKGVGDKNSAEFSAAGLTVNGSAKAGAPADPAAMKKTSDKSKQKATPATAAPVAAAAPPPVAAATKTTAPAATGTAAAATAAAAASAPMTAADKKAARKAAKEEKARLKAVNSTSGTAAAASAPAGK